MGWVKTDSPNKYPYGMRQAGKKGHYVVNTGTNVTALPVMQTGVQGSFPAPGSNLQATGVYIPSTAISIQGFAWVTASSGVVIAPNNTYAGASATSLQWLLTEPASQSGTLYYDMVLESSGQVWWSSNAAGNSIGVFGWEDSY